MLLLACFPAVEGRRACRDVLPLCGCADASKSVAISGGSLFSPEASDTSDPAEAGDAKGDSAGASRRARWPAISRDSGEAEGARGTATSAAGMPPAMLGRRQGPGQKPATQQTDLRLHCERDA